MSGISDTITRVDACELERIRERIVQQCMASPGSDLELMMTEATASLGRSALLRDTSARKTGGSTHLIEVRCYPAAPSLTREAIMAEIEQLWLDELRYDDFAAHTIELTSQHGILDFLTVARAQRLYLSGMIVAHFATS
jgi:hypothetical protein